MRRSHFIGLLILLAAAFYRFYGLPGLPPGLNFDEAGSGVIALDILQGTPKIWWRIGGGQEPLWPYLVALTTAMWGYNALSLRLPAALIGLLTVAAVYPLAIRLFRPGQATWLALVTMAGLAFSEWHLHFSRLGFRAILLPLLSTLALYFSWKGLKGGGTEGTKENPAPRPTFHASPFTLSALFLALSLYAYLAGRLLPVVVLLFLGLSVMVHYIKARRMPGERFFRPYLSILLPLFLPFLLFLLPLILYFSFNPDDFVARSAAVSIFNPAWNEGNLSGAIWRTVRLTLGTFLGGPGDPNPLVNLPGEPALPPLLAIFFVIGWFVSLRESVRGNKPLVKQGWPAPIGAENRFNSYLFLLCWWTVMLLPAILAPEGAPHHLRLIGTLVPTYLLVSLGLLTLSTLLTRLLSRFLTYLPRPPRTSSSPTPYALRITFFTFPLLCFLFIATQTYQNYFNLWPGLVDFTLPFDLYAVRLAEEIAQAPPEVAYILPMDIRAGEEARHYTLDYLLAPLNPRPYTYIPVDERNAETLLAQASAGKGEIRVVRWTADKHQEADAKEIISYLLENSAQPAGRESFPVYDLETYRLFQFAKSPAQGPPFTLPAIDRPIGANFDNLLRLDAAYVAATAKPGTALPVALTLAPLAPMETDYKLSLRLIGPDGTRLAQKDRTLLHNFHQGTSLWPPETVNEYYLLPIPVETPPGEYGVAVVIYHPETLDPLVAEGVVEVPLGPVEVK